MSPFAIVPSPVIAVWSELSPSEKAVTVALASFFAGKPASGCPGNRRLMERSGIRREQTISTAIAGLLDKGLISRTRRVRKSAIYRWADPTQNVESTECADSTPKLSQPNDRCWVSIKKDTNSRKPTGSESLEDDAKQILSAYAHIKPAALDRTRSRAKKHLLKLLKKHGVDDLFRAVKNYGAETQGTEPTYRRGAGNFFGKDRDWEHYAAEDWKPGSRQRQSGGHDGDPDAHLY